MQEILFEVTLGKSLDDIKIKLMEEGAEPSDEADLAVGFCLNKGQVNQVQMLKITANIFDQVVRMMPHEIKPEPKVEAVEAVESSVEQVSIEQPAKAKKSKK